MLCLRRYEGRIIRSAARFFDVYDAMVDYFADMLVP